MWLSYSEGWINKIRTVVLAYRNEISLRIIHVVAIGEGKLCKGIPFKNRSIN